MKRKRGDGSSSDEEEQEASSSFVCNGQSSSSSSTDTPGSSKCPRVEPDVMDDDPSSASDSEDSENDEDHSPCVNSKTPEHSRSHSPGMENFRLEIPSTDMLTKRNLKSSQSSCGNLEVFNPSIKFIHTSQCKGTQQDINRMQHLIEQDPELLNYTDSKDYSSLFDAIFANHDLCVQFLVSNNAELDDVLKFLIELYCKNQADDTHYAALILSRINLILQYATANVLEHVFINKDMFPLIVMHGCHEVLHLFLTYGVNPNGTVEFVLDNGNIRSLSLLSYVIISDICLFRYELLRTLLNNGAIINLDPINCNDICNAIAQYNLNYFKLLLIYYTPIIYKMNDRELKSNAFLMSLMISNIPYYKKFKLLKLFINFGYCFWSIPRPLNIITEAEDLIDDLAEFRSQPMSLKFVCRLTILRSMGSRYMEHKSKLNVPQELHTFLDFPEVQLR